MNFTPIIVAISLAVGFGGAWQLRGHQIDKLKLEQAHEREAVQLSIRTALEANQRQVAAAQTASAKRSVRVRVDSDGSRNAGNGLRLASTATVRASEDFTDACRAVIAAYDTVVSASSDFIQRVSTDADQCHSDLQLITDSWPKE